jgi:osmotically-inducible protein OsmY
VPGDPEITRAVEKSLGQHPDPGPPNMLYVKSVEHVVYLTGTADAGLQRNTAGSLAAQVTGVTKVVNNISVSC